MEKLSDRIFNDVTSTLVNLSGSLKDIACGTRIRIPTGELPKVVSNWICELLQVVRVLRDNLGVDDTDHTEIGGICGGCDNVQCTCED